MHIILLNAVRGRRGEPPKIHELHFDARAQDDDPENTIDLVIVDARELDPAGLNTTIAWVARLRNSQPVRKAVMVCTKPPIEFVVRAIRAGINDIFERPLSGRQLFLLLARDQRAVSSRRAARAVMACGRLLASTAAASDPASAVHLVERERRIEDRQRQFGAESARLEQLRETLHARETELVARAQRLDEEFARLQNDADLNGQATAATNTAPSAAAAAAGDPADVARLQRWEAELAAREAEVEERETALSTRDRMLREFEAMLLSQAPATNR